MSENTPQSASKTTTILHTTTGALNAFAAVAFTIAFALNHEVVFLALAIADLSLSVTFFALAKSSRQRQVRS